MLVTFSSKTVILFILLILFLRYYPRATLFSSPSADIEYTISFNLGKGGSVLIKAKTYSNQVLRFLLYSDVAKTINIVGKSSKLRFDSERGIIEVIPNGEQIWFNYTFPRIIWHYPEENRRILVVVSEKDFIQVHLELFLPYPDFIMKREDALLTLNGIPEDWFTIITYDEKYGNSYYFKRFNILFNTGLLAAKPYYIAQYNGTNFHFYAPIFYGRLLDEALRVDFYLDSAWDIKGVMEYKTRKLGRALEEIANILNLTIPNPAYLYPHIENSRCPDINCEQYINEMILPMYVMLQDSHIYRWGHYVDHFLMVWTETSRWRIGPLIKDRPEFDRFWPKAVRIYLGYSIASKVMVDPRINGSLIIPVYLAYLRLPKQYLRKTYVEGYSNINHIYAPLCMFYLDNVVRELSNNKCTIFKILGEALNEHEWDEVTTEDIVKTARKYGVNIVPYIGEIKTFRLNITRLEKYINSGDHWSNFRLFLNHLRENFTFAPDTIQLAYFEYMIYIGEIEAYFSLYSGYYFDFISKLHMFLKNKPITRKSFLSALNNLTEGHSSDFFEFYSAVPGVTLSIEEVRAFFNGTYTEILGKILAAKYILEEMNNSSLSAMLEEAYNELDAVNYGRALEIIDKLLTIIASMKKVDSDKDGAPDWVERKYGTDPTKPDTDNDGALDAKELFLGKILLDGDLTDWEVNEKEGYVIRNIREDPGIPFRSIRVAYDDIYLYMAVELKDPPFTRRNAYMFSIDLDANWDTTNDRIDVTINTDLQRFIGESLQRNLFMGDVMELRLPLYVLKLLGLKDRFLIMFGGRYRKPIGISLDIDPLEVEWLEGIDVMVDLSVLKKLPSYYSLNIIMSSGFYLYINGTKYTLNATCGAILLPKGVYSIYINSVFYYRNDTRFLFKEWGDGYKNTTRIIYLDKDIVLKPIYLSQYYVSVIGGNGSGWYNANTTIIVTTNQYINFNNNTRLVFNSWSNGVKSISQKIKVDKPITLHALWKKQYYISAMSIYGNTSGSGWYDAGSKVTISISKTIISGKNMFLNKVFKGWRDETGEIVSTKPTYTFTANSPKTFTAIWKEELNTTLTIPIVAVIVILLTIIVSLIKWKQKRL